MTTHVKCGLPEKLLRDSGPRVFIGDGSGSLSLTCSKILDPQKESTNYTVCTKFGHSELPLPALGMVGTLLTSNFSDVSRVFTAVRCVNSLLHTQIHLNVFWTE